MMNNVQLKLQVESLSSKATTIKFNKHSSNKFSKFKIHFQHMKLHQVPCQVSSSHPKNLNEISLLLQQQAQF
jgi:hypothetical protein